MVSEDELASDARQLQEAIDTQGDCPISIEDLHAEFMKDPGYRFWHYVYSVKAWIDKLTRRTTHDV